MEESPPTVPPSAPGEPNQGTQITGNVSTEGGDFIGRDKTVAGDEVRGDKLQIGAQYNYYGVLQPPPTEDNQDDDTPAPGESPYKGLEFFDVSDAEIFFGREQLTAELVAHLRQHRFLAVVGASGSGKSSVVRAGLVPALKRDSPLVDGTLSPKGSQHWLISILTPTARPLKELATKLTPDEPDKVTLAVMDDLASDARVLDVRASKLLTQSPGKSRLLLVIDQFEELFTLCKNKDERKAFVENVLTATTIDGPTIAVITLRADFYAYCAEFDHLRQMLANYQEYIGPMSRNELRRAIEEPARLEGWEFEPGLVDLMLEDAGEEPGALPLLSHALLETWQRRRGRNLTFAGYQASGRVQGAIAQTANRVYMTQSPEQQQIARTIFLRLTELGEGAQDTRRRVDLNELIPTPAERPAVGAVLKTLADARLVTTSQEAVEVAHEALIREWPRLREWLAENREWLRLHRRLTEAAQEWTKLKYDPDVLYRGLRLQQVQEWTAKYADELNALERDFLKASQELIDAEKRQKEQNEIEREASRQRELRHLQDLAAEAEARRQAEIERVQEVEERERVQAKANSRLRRYLVGLSVMFIEVVLFNVIVYYMMTINLRAEVVQSTRRQVTDIASTVAEQIEGEWFIFKSEAIAPSNALEFFNSVEVQVIDLTGRIVRSSGAVTDSVISINNDSTLAYIREGKHYFFYTTSKSGSPLLVYSVPLSVNNSILGAVQIIRDVSELEHTVTQVRRYLLMGTAISLLFAAVLVLPIFISRRNALPR